MRALVQRVSKAAAAVQGETLGAIGPGLVVFLGVGSGDSLDDARYLADKVLNLRILPDDDGRFNRSALDANAGLLLVSQFTLYADTRKGRRPGFTGAAPPEEAEDLFRQAVDLFRASGLHVAEGRFAAHMAVELVNDGPVTIWIDSADRHRPRR